MNKPSTLFDIIISRIKNNRLLALLLIVGMIVIALSQFTDATKRIWGLFSSSVNVTGNWKTKILTDPYWVNTYYELQFEFKSTDGTLRGVVTKIYKEGHKREKAFLDGKIQGNTISFYTNEELHGVKKYEPGKRLAFEKIDYKLIYSGTVLKNKIEFMLYSDLPNFKPLKFEAIRN